MFRDTVIVGIIFRWTMCLLIGFIFEPY